MTKRKSLLAFVLLLALAVYCFAAFPVTDDFNRADGAVGGSWLTTTWFTSGNYVAPIILSNQLAGNTTNRNGVLIYNATFTSDQWAQADFIGLGTGKLLLRADASAKNGYDLNVRSGSTSQLQKYAAGSAGFLKNCQIITSGTTVKLSVSGTTLSLLANGSDGCTGGFTDSTYSSGNIGVWLGAASTAPGDIIDNFSADCIPTCGGGTPARRRQPIISSWSLTPKLYAQTSDSVRVYLMPSVTNANGKEPKYMSLLGPDAAGMDYGPEDDYIVASTVTAEQHAALIANADVLAIPQNLDANLTAGAVTTAQNWLEGRNIPADWVTTSLSYRQVLRIVAQMFQFAQRYQAVSNNARLFPAGTTLATTIGKLDATTKANWQNTASSLGYSFAGINNSSTTRQALKTLGQQWGSRPIYLGGVTL